MVRKRQEDEYSEGWTDSEGGHYDDGELGDEWEKVEEGSDDGHSDDQSESDSTEGGSREEEAKKGSDGGHSDESHSGSEGGSGSEDESDEEYDPNASTSSSGETGSEDEDDEDGKKRKKKKKKKEGEEDGEKLVGMQAKLALGLDPDAFKKQGEWEAGAISAPEEALGDLELAIVDSEKQEVVEKPMSKISRCRRLVCLPCVKCRGALRRLLSRTECGERLVERFDNFRERCAELRTKISSGITRCLKPIRGCAKWSLSKCGWLKKRFQESRFGRCCAWFCTRLCLICMICCKPCIRVFRVCRKLIRVCLLDRIKRMREKRKKKKKKAADEKKDEKAWEDMDEDEREMKLEEDKAREIEEMQARGEHQVSSLKKNFREARAAAGLGREVAQVGLSPSKAGASPSRRTKDGKVVTAKLATATPSKGKEEESPSKKKKESPSKGRRGKMQAVQTSSPSKKKEKETGKLEVKDGKATVILEKAPKETWKQWWKRKKQEKKERLAEIELILDVLEEEEEWDWNNVDEDGNPKKNVFLIPKAIRRRWRWTLFVYWDPVLDMWDRIKAIDYRTALIRLVIAAPFVAFLGSVGYLLEGVYENFAYQETVCSVERMPPSESWRFFGGVDPKVEGIYGVARDYMSTPIELGGVAHQNCSIVVPCVTMYWGAEDDYSDDRCVEFQTYHWGDEVACWYHWTDIDGSKGTTAYCLGQPRDLVKERIIMLVLGMGISLILAIFAVRWWQRRVERASELAALAQELQEAEELAGAKLAREQEDMQRLKAVVEQERKEKEEEKRRKEARMKGKMALGQDVDDDED